MHFGAIQVKDSIALDEVINEEWQGMQKEHFLLLVMFCLGMKSCTHTHTFCSLQHYTCIPHWPSPYLP